MLKPRSYDEMTKNLFDAVKKLSEGLDANPDGPIEALVRFVKENKNAVKTIIKLIEEEEVESAKTTES